MSDVPTEFQEAFTEKDGQAVFAGGEFEFETQTAVETIRKAKQKAFDDFHELKTKYKDFDGLDPTKYKEMQDELDLLRVRVKDGGTEEEIKDLVDIKVKRKTEELASENNSLKEKIGLLEGFKSQTEKDSVLNEALKGVSKDVVEDAKYIIGSVIERQADGTFMSNGKNGFEAGLSVEQVVAKASESRPHWIKKNTPGHGAGGANGGGGVSKQARFNELYAKKDKSRAEVQELNTIAAEIKQEREGK
jgi:hypothetical protein